MTKKQVAVGIALVVIIFTAGFVCNHTVLAKSQSQLVVKAQEFQLTNQAGVTRASLSLSSKGHLLIALHDNQGKLVDILLVTPELIASSRATADRLMKLEKIMSKMFPGM